MTEFKHADELLDDVWRQRYEAFMQHFRPKLVIWMNRLDIETIIRERTDLFALTDYDIKTMYPTRLFGEKLVCAQDIKVGEPIVEVVNDQTINT